MPPSTRSRTMRAAASTIAVLAILAGCVTPAGDVEPQAAGALSALLGEPVLERSLVVDPTRWSGEPSILALADGTLLITGAGGLTRYLEDPTAIPGNFGSSYVWRSTDAGATWAFVDLGLPAPASALLPYRNAILGVEGDLAQDEAGRAYFVDLTMLATNGVAASDDGGATWTAAQSPLVGAPPADRPWIAAMGDGVVYVKYLGSRGHHVARSTDGGMTFLEDVLLPPCGQGPLVVDLAAREVLVPCAQGKELSLLRTPEGTMEWERVDALTVEGDPSNVFVALAVADARQYVLAWSEARGELATLRALASLDGGATWSAPVALSSPERTAVFPWADASLDGTVGVVWYEADAAGAPDTLDAAWFPMHAQLALGPDGLATGATTRLSAEKIHQGAICTSGLGCVLSGRSEDRRLLDFFEVDVDPAGVSHVTWTNTQGEFPTVWYGQVRKAFAGEAASAGG